MIASWWKQMVPHLHATWMVLLGRCCVFHGDVHRAILWLRAALEQVERIPDQAGGDPELRPSCEVDSLELADTLNSLGMTLQQRDPAAAETLLRRALAICRRCLAAGEEPLLTSHNNLGQLLMHQGQQQAARALFEEGLSSAGKPAGRGSETHQPNARVLAYLAFHCGQIQLAGNQLQPAVTAGTPSGRIEPEALLVSPSLKIMI